MKLAVVYRCYSASGELLYVGLTTQPFQRVRVHGMQTPWWSQVDRMEYDEPRPLEIARRSERGQIHRLAPPMNRTGHHSAPRSISFAGPKLQQVGRNIRRARAELGHSQDSIGRALGITRRAVGLWESGRTVPSRGNLEALGDLLGRDPAWFYAIHDEPVAA